MSEQIEPPRKQYMIAAGLVLTIIVVFSGATVTLGIFLISPEFLVPAKSIFADRVVMLLAAGFWFLFGWIIRGMSE